MCAKSPRLSRGGTILCFYLIKALTGQPGKVYSPEITGFFLSATR